MDEVTVTPETESELTTLVLFRNQLRKLRIAESNRAEAAGTAGEIHQTYAAVLLALETEITDYVSRLVLGGLNRPTNPAAPAVGRLSP